MCSRFSIVFALVVIYVADALDNDISKIYVEQDLDSTELFPVEFGLQFSHNGKQLDLILTRNDDATSQLSSFIFNASRFLPTGVFSEGTSKGYSSYSSDVADIVMHRRSTSSPGKVYGQVVLDHQKYALVPQDDSLFQYTLSPILERKLMPDIDIRIKREDIENAQSGLTEYTNVVELFVIADYSIYEFWASSVGSSTEPRDIRAGINDWLNSLMRDALFSKNTYRLFRDTVIRSDRVDTLFKRVKDYSSVDVRIYVQGMFISSDHKETPWINGAINEYINDASSVLDNIGDYYQAMVDKYAFPNADHVMVLTRYNLDSGDQFFTKNTMCGVGKRKAVSYVNTMYSVKPIAQAIAASMGVRLDGSPDSPCEVTDNFVMSPDYTSPVSSTNQENPWKFSLCSILYLQQFIESGQGSCLLTSDTHVEFKTIIQKQPVGLRYSPREQCAIAFGRASSFCTLKDNNEMSECFNQREGCMVDGFCVPYHMGDFTSCGADSGCRYGSCRSKRELSHSNVNAMPFHTTHFYSSSVGSSVMSSATTTMEKNLQSSTTSTTAPTTTTETNLQTSTAGTTTSTAGTTTSTAGTTTSTAPTTTTETNLQTSTAGTTTSTAGTTTSTAGTTSSTAPTTSTETNLQTSTTGTTTSTAPTTTTETNLQSTSTASPTTTTEKRTTTEDPFACVVDFGFKDVTLPGCGCCGGCGCDTTCDSCPNGFGRPATTLNSEVCNITENCCPGKIRIYTSFIPADCDVTVTPDNQTLVIDKTGWEMTNLDVNAVAKPTGSGGWTVAFE